MSEEEIGTILSASEREGVLNPEETKMIRGVFDLDEYGGTAGVITLDDILEEIVGEYADEFTRHQYRYIKKLSGSQFAIDAGIRVSELEPLVNSPFPTGDYVTLGGLIYHEFGRIPVVGDRVEL